MDIPCQYLSYDFTYEGMRHKGKILLDEDTPNLQTMYDDHDIEITWVKRIPHKGRFVELNIVICDDANMPEMEGRVVASAWVCVYRSKRNPCLLDQFEPEHWSYVDEACPANNVDKLTFYS